MKYTQFKKVKTQGGTTIKYLISDEGTVKLEAYYKDICLGTEDLYIGHGMYIKDHEINIYHCSGMIYRIIYTLFKGNIPKGYQIHHIDYNHYNNNIDNLLCCTPRQHGVHHAFQGRFSNGYPPIDDEEKTKYEQWNNARYYMLKMDSINYTIQDAQKDIKEIYKKFDDKAYKIRQEIKLKKQLEKPSREDIIRQKIESGEYYLNDKGRLVKKNKKKWTEEQREQIKEKRKHVYESKEWRQRVSEGVKKAYIEDETYRKRVAKGVSLYRRKKKEQ